MNKDKYQVGYESTQAGKKLFSEEKYHPKVSEILKDRVPRMYTEGCERTLSNVIYAIKKRKGLFLTLHSGGMFFIKFEGVPSIFDLTNKEFGKLDTRQSGLHLVYLLKELRNILGLKSYNENTYSIMKRLSEKNYIPQIATLGIQGGYGIVYINDNLVLKQSDENFFWTENTQYAITHKHIKIGYTNIAKRKKHTKPKNLLSYASGCGSKAKAYPNKNHWAFKVTCERLERIHKNYINNEKFEPIPYLKDTSAYNPTSSHLRDIPPQCG